MNKFNATKFESELFVKVLDASKFEAALTQLRDGGFKFVSSKEGQALMTDARSYVFGSFSYSPLIESGRYWK